MGCGATQEAVVEAPIKVPFKMKEKPNKIERAKKQRERKLQEAQEAAAAENRGPEIVNIDPVVQQACSMVAQRLLCVAAGGLVEAEVLPVFLANGAANNATASAMWAEIRQLLVGTTEVDGACAFTAEERESQCERQEITGQKAVEVHAEVAKLFMGLADPDADRVYAERFKQNKELWPHLVRWLPYHLTKAADKEQVELLLTDIIFLEEKCRYDVPGLLDDYWRAKQELGLGEEHGSPMEEFFALVQQNCDELMKPGGHELLFEFAYNLPSGCAPTQAAHGLLTGMARRRNIRDDRRTKEREWAVRWAKGVLKSTATSALIHSGAVKSALYSPDNSCVVTACNAECRLWAIEDLTNPTLWVKCPTGSWDTVSEVTCMAFCDDSKRVCTGGLDGILRVWDLATMSLDAAGELKGHDSPISSITVSKSLIGTTSQDGVICVWDLLSYVRVSRLEGHKGPVRAISFSMDEKTVATGSEDRNIGFWNLTIGRGMEQERLAQLRLAEATARSEAGNADYAEKETRIAETKKDLEAADKKLETQPADTGKAFDFKMLEDQKVAMKLRSSLRLQEEQLEKAEMECFELQEAVDAEKVILEKKKEKLADLIRQEGTLLTLLWDKDLQHIDWETQTSHMRAVTALDFSKDGVALASGGDDWMIKIWDKAERVVTATLKCHQAPVSMISFNDCGDRLLSCGEDKRVVLWDMDILVDLKTLSGHRENVYTAQFNKEGTHVLTASMDKTARIWDLALDPEVRPPESHGRRGYDSYKEKSRARNARLREQKKGRYLQSTDKEEVVSDSDGHSASVNCVAFAHQGQWLASGSSDLSVKVWDASQFCIRQTMTGHEGGVNCIEWAPDDLTVYSGSDDSIVKVWDVLSNLCIATMAGHSARVNTVKVNKEGDLCASASDDCTIKIWYMPFVFTEVSGLPLVGMKKFRHQLDHKAAVTCLSFAPNGSALISGSLDMSIKVWDHLSGECRMVLEGHQETVTSLVVSPDSMMIASGMGDYSIKLWSCITGQCKDSLGPINSKKITSLAFSEGQHDLASTSEDGTMVLWECASCKPRKEVKGNFGPMRSVCYSPGAHDLTIASGSDLFTFTRIKDNSIPNINSGGAGRT